MSKPFSRRIGPPYVIVEGCIDCLACIRACTFDAIFMDDNLETIVEQADCPGCRRCTSEEACPVNAIVRGGTERAALVRDSQREHLVETDVPGETVR